MYRHPSLCLTVIPALLGCLLSGGAVVAAEQTPEAALIKKIDGLGENKEGTDDAVATLTGELANPSAAVRAHAAHSLGKLGAAAKPAVTKLAELIKDEDAVVRQQALKAILAIRPGPEVTIPLCVKLLEDKDSGVRLRVLDAISNAGPAAIPGLIQALGNEKAAYWACLVLRNMGHAAKDAVPALTKSLDSKDVEVQREALLALGAIGPAAEPSAVKIAKLLNNPLLCEAATFALGQIGHIPAAAVETIKANAKGDDKFLATLSYWTMARVHPDNKELRKEITTRLVEMLTDKEPFVRASAARALAALPPAPEITLPIWDKVLANADEETAGNAIGAIAQLGPEAIPRLVTLLKFKSHRGEIANILGHYGAKSAPATAALIELLGDSDKKVVTEAAIAIGKIGPHAQSAAPALTALLAKEECPNAHAIAMALGKIGPSAASAEPVILKSMQSKDSMLAGISAWALVRMFPNSAEKAAKAIPILVVGLKEPLPESRIAAAEALGSLGKHSVAAIPALEKSTHDSSAAVRTAAAKAIQAINTSN